MAHCATHWPSRAYEVAGWSPELLFQWELQEVQEAGPYIVSSESSISKCTAFSRWGGIVSVRTDALSRIIGAHEHLRCPNNAAYLQKSNHTCAIHILLGALCTSSWQPESCIITINHWYSIKYALLYAELITSTGLKCAYLSDLVMSKSAVLTRIVVPIKPEMVVMTTCSRGLQFHLTN